MPNARKFHPGAANVPTAIDWVELDLSEEDADLTDPAGPTGGYCARAVKIGETAGDLKIDTLLGTARVLPVAAFETVMGAVSKVYSDGTDADKVFVGL